MVGSCPKHKILYSFLGAKIFKIFEALQNNFQEYHLVPNYFFSPIMINKTYLEIIVFDTSNSSISEHFEEIEMAERNVFLISTLILLVILYLMIEIVQHIPLPEPSESFEELQYKQYKEIAEVNIVLKY